MSDERNCGSCLHAELGERPVGRPGAPGFWIDRSGRCKLADHLAAAMNAHLKAINGKLPLPAPLYLAGASVVAPPHHSECPAWRPREAR